MKSFITFIAEEVNDFKDFEKMKPVSVTKEKSAWGKFINYRLFNKNDRCAG